MPGTFPPHGSFRGSVDRGQFGRSRQATLPTLNHARISFFWRDSPVSDVKFAGQVAVVTGAATGIGAAIAERLAEEGADLFLQYHTRRGALDALVERCRDQGRRAEVTRADFARDPGEAAQVIRDAIASLGRADILVNNAAVTTKNQAFPTHDRRLFEEILSVNVMAVFLASQALASHLIERRAKGRIINISSVHSRMSAPGNVAYETSKGAINALTFATAIALGPYGITVNAVAPGAIWVERYADLPNFDEAWYRSRIPLGRLGSVNDIAGVVTFLASDEADYITGETIYVDGGLTRRMPLVR